MCDLLVGRMESCMALSTAEAKYVATCYFGGSMFLLKLLFDLIDLTCIFWYDAERSSKALVCDTD